MHDNFQSPGRQMPPGLFRDLRKKPHPSCRAIPPRITGIQQSMTFVDAAPAMA